MVATVAFCKDNAISTLNGGQDPSLSCVAGDLVLDMSGMSGVHVDLEANVARVELGPFRIFRQLDYELELHGVCVPSPIFSLIGVAGAFLGGGWGYFFVPTKRSCVFWGWTGARSARSLLRELDARSAAARD